MLAFHLSTFKVDATPPLGHPLCGGWIKAAVAIDDRLWLRGLVLEGAGLPIVVAARLDRGPERIAPPLDRGPRPSRTHHA